MTAFKTSQPPISSQFQRQLHFVNLPLAFHSSGIMAVIETGLVWWTSPLCWLVILRKGILFSVYYANLRTLFIWISYNTVLNFNLWVLEVVMLYFDSLWRQTSSPFDSSQVDTFNCRCSMNMHFSISRNKVNFQMAVEEQLCRSTQFYFCLWRIKKVLCYKLSIMFQLAWAVWFICVASSGRSLRAKKDYQHEALHFRENPL